MKKYDPKQIEAKWQQIWADTKLNKTGETPGKPKLYVLDYFPYPSGAGLSVGHVRNYTISDVYPRFKRMHGYNVLHPMGWDAFGLPAENYAIKNKVSPRQATDQNKANYKRQMQMVGLSYDWDREVDSSDPNYYKWTQWFFLLLYKRKLAYQQDSEQWWCDTDQTVLANEQVEAGKCWRCGNVVTKKTLKQWFFKITDYADRLADDLDAVDWPDNIKSMQRNWIGRSNGVKLKFKVDGSKDELEAFTTRVDTLAGATFMVIAPEHPLADQLVTKEHQGEFDKYAKKVLSESEIERMDTDRTKTGVFTGSYALNPLTGDKLPIWAADYVLMGYGTGAIMAVPAHDERDFEFANKFDLPIKLVIDPVFVREDAKAMTEFKQKRKIVALVENDKGEILTINWGPKLGGRLTIGGTVEGNESPEVTARREVEEETGYHDLELVEVAPETVHYKYYAFSKKEAHEAEVRFVHLKLKGHSQKAQKLDESEKDNFEVEWVSREVVEREITEPLHRYGYDRFVAGKVYAGEGVLTNSGKYDGLIGTEAKHKITEDLYKQGLAEATTNYKLRDWLISRQRYWGAPIPIIHCPKCGVVPVPEDQLPVELPETDDYRPSGDGRSPLARVKDWVEVNCPKCGGEAKRETDTMDGFACSSWYFLRFASPNYDQAAFDPAAVKYWLPVDMYIGGAEHAVMHLLYARFWTKVMHDAKLVDFSEPFKTLRNQGMVLASDGRKMSKSYGNVIAPEEVIGKGYGADTLRVYEMFMAPYNQEVAWSEQGLIGVYRFLQRIWTLFQEFQTAKDSDADNASENATALTRETHKTIQRVTHDLEHFHFNTAVAALMEYVNFLYKLKLDLSFGSASDEWREAIGVLTQLLAPFAPHLTEELWQQLGGETSVHASTWPRYDEAMVKNEIIEIPVQVNGKLRAVITLPPDSDEKLVIDTAKSQPAIAKYLGEGKLIKTIYVPLKLINLVVK